jgi:imidazolonepropionase-like amidohydrolase
MGCFHGSVRALAAHGARIVYGTDLGNEGTAPRLSAEELEALARDGVDPLRAATADAAELLGLPDHGRLAEGCAASLLAVRSTKPRDLAGPQWVMNCGKVLR